MPTAPARFTYVVIRRRRYIPQPRVAQRTLGTTPREGKTPTGFHTWTGLIPENPPRHQVRPPNDGTQAAMLVPPDTIQFFRLFSAGPHPVRVDANPSANGLSGCDDILRAGAGLPKATATRSSDGSSKRTHGNISEFQAIEMTTNHG
jgi:hypothetical protein